MRLNPGLAPTLSLLTCRAPALRYKTIRLLAVGQGRDDVVDRSREHRRRRLMAGHRGCDKADQAVLMVLAKCVMRVWTWSGTQVKKSITHVQRGAAETFCTRRLVFYQAEAPEVSVHRCDDSKRDCRSACLPAVPDGMFAQPLAGVWQPRRRHKKKNRALSAM